MSKLHTLFIGINYYASPNVNNLHGCENDVLAFKDFIDEHWKATQSLLLLNSQATKVNIIRAFEYLANSTNSGDHVLIYYSGHGSRAKTAPELKDFSEGGKDESWVCYDSRTADEDGQYIHDLRDKEIAYLISQFPKDLATCLFISDSCHSDSITRSGLGNSLVARQQHDDCREITLEEYYGYGTDSWKALEAGKEKYGADPLPKNAVISLSACSRYELAWEQEGKGVFTQALIEALTYQKDASYLELFPRALASVRHQLAGRESQTPQIQAFHGMSAGRSFLSDKYVSSTNRLFPISTEGNGIWEIACGVGHGLDRNAEGATIECFSDPQGKQPIGKAELEQVLLTDSHIDWIDATPSSTSTIYGRVEATSTYSILVASDLILRGADQYPTIQFTEDTSIADFIVIQNADGTTTISDASGKHCITFPDANNHEGILGALAQLGYYQHILRITNPSSDLQEDFEFVLELGGKQFVANKDQPFVEVKMGVKAYDRQIPLKLRLKTDTYGNTPIEVALMYMGPDYDISFIHLKGGEKVKSFQGEEEERLLRDALVLLKKRGKSVTNHFKLLVSNKSFDTIVFERKKLERLRSKDRDMGSKDKAGWIWDYCAKTFSIELFLEDQPLDGKTIEFDEVAITPPAGLKGNVSKEQTSDIGSRSPKALSIPKIKGIAPLMKSVLDFTGIEGSNTLKEDPLIIEAKGLEENEEALALAFDGEIWLPVGISKGGKLAIDELPEEKDETRSRSLGKALRLCLFKLTPMNLLGLNDLAFQLKHVDERHASVSREFTLPTNGNRYAPEIANDKKLLLIIHGIIGDTSTMVLQLRFATQRLGYDRILTFDYENLNTPIEETARKLKRKLAAIGLSEGHDKQVDIVAHSMGGLISRWFIEKEGGDKVVSNLVMLGTPNKGSLLGHISNILPLTTMALNYVQPQAGWLLTALNYVKQAGKVNSILTATLKQLLPQSEFLTALAESPKVSTQYHVLAGDIAQFEYPKHDHYEVLFNRLTEKFGWAVNKGQPNDLAVAIDSIQGIEHQPNVTKHEVLPCHHLNYFEESRSLKVLTEALRNSKPIR